MANIIIGNWIKYHDEWCVLIPHDANLEHKYIIRIDSVKGNIGGNVLLKKQIAVTKYGKIFSVD